MKKHVRLFIALCLGLFLSGATLDALAWGGDITLPVTAGYRYSDARVSVAYDGSIYYGRLYSTTLSGPLDHWEVLKSTDNGVTFTNLVGSFVSGSDKYTAFDIICAGENSTDFGLFVVRSFFDTVSHDAQIMLYKYDSAGVYVASVVNETYNYAARGWLSVSLATDSRDKNTISSPYVISLAAAKAGGLDSIIAWTGADGGTTMHRVGLASTGGFMRSVSASVGSTISATSGIGRLGVTWMESPGSIDLWGSVYTRFVWPDDGTAPTYTGPYAIDAGNTHYRNPCIVISQNTAGGGTGPGSSDFRAIVTLEYDGNGAIWGAVYDSLVLHDPGMYQWSNISPGTTGLNSMCHGVYDPLYDNFLFTFLNDAANTLPYAIKGLGTSPTGDALLFQPNYRDLGTVSSAKMFPRVDMSISRGMAAFAWNDNTNTLFDAEWSTVAGISANTGITDLNLYPNPASELTNISFVADGSQAITMTVFDLTGRIVMNNGYQVNQGSNLITFDVNSLQAGNYIVSLNGSTINTSIRLLVTK